MKKKIFQYLGLISFLCLFSCCETQNNTEKLELPFQKYSMESDTIQKELDEIYSLFAYSLVFKDWQPDSIPRNKRRGYNIGTILVDPDNNVVHWGVNCVNITNNSTQHGEVRAIMSYLDSLKLYNLKGFTLYTTLEPCAMCSGMMTMTNIKRVVYGQNDVDFSGALDRLALNSEKFGGYKPYPRTVISDPAPSTFIVELNSAYSVYCENEEEKYLSKFLTSDKAWQIYYKATKKFQGYDIKYPENLKYYEQAKLFLNKINFQRENK